MSVNKMQNITAAQQNTILLQRASVCPTTTMVPLKHWNPTRTEQNICQIHNYKRQLFTESSMKPQYLSQIKSNFL